MRVADLVTRREMLRLGAAGAALPLFPAPAMASDPLATVREQALRHVEDGEVPSLSIAVFQHGRPLWVEAFGWADRARQIAATPTTAYAIASASKPFTATAVAHLIASRLLSLDAPLATCLAAGTIDPRSRTISVREALQHRSGIPRHWRNFFAGQGRPPPFAEVARAYAFATPAQGRRYLYSNLNYGLLAATVDRVAGPFHEYLRETVFAPLRLAGASTLADHFDDWRAAIPYENDGTPIPPYLVDEMGARDLVMTASDLARFGVAHLEGRLGPLSSLMISERADIGADGAGRVSYGLGWIVEEDSPAALFSYGHTGEGPGAASSLTIVPEEQLVVATVANAQGAPAYVLNEAVVDAVSERFAERRRAHPYEEQGHDDEALRRLEGRWAGEMKTLEGSHPVTLAKTADSDWTLAVGREPAARLMLPAMRGGWFSGRADLNLPASDARRWPHQTRLMLEELEGRLEGTIAAYAGRGAIPHDQFWLSYRLRLSRA